MAPLGGAAGAAELRRSDEVMHQWTTTIIAHSYDEGDTRGALVFRVMEAIPRLAGRGLVGAERARGGNLGQFEPTQPTAAQRERTEQQPQQTAEA